MRVEIETVAAPLISHAAAHNGLPVVHRITVTIPHQTNAPDDPRAIGSLTIAAEIRDHTGAVITRPWHTVIENVEPARPVTVEAPALRLVPFALADLDEEAGGEIVVSVQPTPSDHGAVSEASSPALAYTPIRLLAARQWLVDPDSPLLSLQLLAAFVQPNHPDIATLVPRIGHHLAEHTRSPSLAVTDVRPERIDAIVEAAAMALHEAQISYARPPASWGYGQKVRSLGDVLGQQLGTCLDTTLALAGVLEHLGIAPVLWIARGHSFLGWWRQPSLGLPDAVSLQVSSAVNAVDLNLIGVLETTLLTRDHRPPRDVFRRARQCALDTYFRGGTDELVGVIDVSLARTTGALPLPAHRDRPDGVREVHEYHAATPDLRPNTLDRAATTPPQRTPAPPAEKRTAAPPRIQAWKNALLDLSLRNPLLTMGRGMTNLPLLIPHEHLGAFTDLLQDGAKVSLRAVDDLAWAVVARGVARADTLPGDVQRSMLVERHTVFSELDDVPHGRTVERLRYRARTAAQETGANLLAVTLGRLDWTLGDRALSAPLLIAPARLDGVIRPHRIALDPAGQISLNLSLVEKLRQEFGFTVPGLNDLPQRAGDEAGVDVDAAIRLMREAIAASGLPFRVDGEARLAIVSFTGYLLWRDLDEYWEQFLQRPLVRHLTLTPTEPYPAPDQLIPPGLTLDDIVAAAPVPTDSSQAEAVAAARSGASFVLEGPPGTGKSQTITTIIADQMAQGRTVLFVAEKGAALDVVRARLEQTGLAPFTLDLHDEGSRPNQVRLQLRRALAQRPEPDLDAHQIAATDTASGAAVLRDYAERVHQPNPAGLSLYGAHGLRLARGTGPLLTVPPDAVGARDAVSAALPQLLALGETTWTNWGFARQLPTTPNDEWWAAVDTADSTVAAARVAIGPLGPRTTAALAAAATDEELASTAWLLTGSATDPAVVHEMSSPRWRAARAELSERSATLRANASTVLERFTPEALTAPLDGVRQSVREAADSFFIGRKKRLLAAAAPVLVHLRPGAPLQARELPGLVEELADLATQAAGLVAGWRALPGCVVLPPTLNPLADSGSERITELLENLDADAARSAALPEALALAVRRARAAEPPLAALTHQVLDEAARSLQQVRTLTGADVSDQARYAAGTGLLEQWAAGAAGRAADRPAGYALRRWVAAVTALATLDGRADTARWQLLSGRISPHDAVAALDRGLAVASVEERLQATGLSGFDPVGHQTTLDRYLEAGQHLRDSLRTVIPATVVGHRPFRPGTMLGTVAALEREVNRSRGGLSVRRLIEKFGPVIAEVTPCVLVSPDSLARFVPPGAVNFDLAVFDEASQITVADAVGALGRSAAAVIAGDSQQMPPTAFAQAVHPDQVDEELSDFVLIPDEESVLSEGVAAGLPRLWLSWHYRSQDESLIAFSNARYYEGKLQSFPAVPGRALDSGLSLTRVNGTFHRSARRPISGSAESLLRTNPVEARAVADEVLRRWSAGERSLGVVTFNVQQRALIEQLLVESGRPGLAESLDDRHDGVFVKNLENVQGDERDVVLFSTAFSPTENGTLPLNFGPLNRIGGQRRLNVAITRARRRVMVFSSFDPEHLRVEATSSVGIRDLRDFLELARDGGGDSSPALAAQAAPADRHRDEIAARLRDRGLQVRTGLGLSEFRVDLAVSAPEAPDGAPAVLAVLLDSPAWGRRRTTADRDALPVTVLRDIMGWPDVARIWLPAWLRDPEPVLDQVIDQARQAAVRPLHRDEHRISRISTVIEPNPEPRADPDPERPAPTGALSRWAEPFVPYEPLPAGPPSVLDRLSTGRRLEPVLTAIREAVFAEGPISPTRLARLVVRRFGVTRLQPQRQQEIMAVLPPDLVRDAEGFIWPRERDPATWQGYRTFGGPARERPLDDVALREIANALTDLAQGAMGISVEDLLRATHRLFGGTRLTEAARARLLNAVQLAVAQDRLDVVAGLVTAPMMER